MGPEQVRGRPLDKRADVFAVGVILYELTTGRRLFRGTDIQVMTQIVEQDVTRPSALLPNYPPELEAIVLGGLTRDRSKRTPSAAHLALALDQFCMRHGLVTGPLMISHYIRSLFPYERAREEGMGIAQVATSTGAPAPSADSSELDEEITSTGDRQAPTPAEEMEERLLREELRALALQRTEVGRPSPLESGGRPPRPVMSAPPPRSPSEMSSALRERAHSLVPPPVRAMPDGNVGAIEELTVDDLIDEERTGPSNVENDDHLGLDRFDEDEEVKPVVLLSPKRKSEGKGTTEGAFMSDLERRLREEAD
jgi:serine/threonine-protein kinase